MQMGRLKLRNAKNPTQLRLGLVLSSYKSLGLPHEGEKPAGGVHLRLHHTHSLPLSPHFVLR